MLYTRNSRTYLIYYILILVPSKGPAVNINAFEAVDDSKACEGQPDHRIVTVYWKVCDDIKHFVLVLYLLVLLLNLLNKSIRIYFKRIL